MEITVEQLRQYIHMWRREVEGVHLEVFSAHVRAAGTDEWRALDMSELQQGYAAWCAAHPNFHTLDAVQHLAEDGRPELWIYCEKDPEPARPPKPLGDLPYEEREPYLLAVLRPGVAELLTKIVTRRRPHNSRDTTGVEFVEWMIKRHHFECYLCPEGTLEAAAADLREELYDLTLRDAAQRAEIYRLHDALLAIDRTYTHTEPEAKALAEIIRITQAALHPAAEDASAGGQDASAAPQTHPALAPTPNASATLAAGREPPAGEAWIESAFQAGSVAAGNRFLNHESDETPDWATTTPTYRLWWWRGYYYQRDQLEHVPASGAPGPAAA